jgi:hypothetical protein
VQKDEYRVAATQALRLYFDIGTFFNDYERFVFLGHVGALLLWVILFLDLASNL